MIQLTPHGGLFHTGWSWWDQRSPVGGRCCSALCSCAGGWREKSRESLRSCGYCWEMPKNKQVRSEDHLRLVHKTQSLSLKGEVRVWKTFQCLSCTAAEAEYLKYDTWSVRWFRHTLAQTRSPAFANGGVRVHVWPHLSATCSGTDLSSFPKACLTLTVEWTSCTRHTSTHLRTHTRVLSPYTTFSGLSH